MRLAARLSHRLNNILAVIVGNSAFLREMGSLSEEQVAALADLEAACEMAIELAGHLQSYAGSAAFHPQFVDLRKLVEHAAMTLKESFQGVALHTVLPDEPCIVSLDHSQAVNALTELARNAQAANCERLSIEVSVQLVEARPLALLRVRDDGEGMPPPVLAKATEPMFTTRRDTAGWGLSLLTGFVRQSGGQTRIESAPGKGTQVEIWLPIAAPGR